ncbi:hypothetical protein B9Z55_002488 [Caenorhabditis nigoni]|uniref:F-box domain-containing protein n=1 Tax=Caenorhabditis nigoni TaxID=1611254 RepID=A0A2G5VKY2_9PELO|nr:hypothetical protein B9Z55_002488 [Caenorhabditis nigoni]
MTGKSSTDPIYDTNWPDMPPEIKLKCIRKLKFRDRLSLRCTAKAERSLVDSQKIDFTKGMFWGTDKFLGLMLYRDNHFDVGKCSADIKEEPFKLMNYIKKVGVFENLQFTCGSSFTDNQQFVTDIELFTARQIEFDVYNNANVVALLRKMKDGIESIKIDFHIEMEYSLDEILAVSHVQNVPYWHIKDYNETDSLRKVAQMWIDKNSEVGCTFQVSIEEKDGSFEVFLEHFTDRIVSKNEKRVRIHTNHPDRHILLERGLNDYVEDDDFPQFFRLLVIPTGMKESEYDENCKEWICKIDPEYYDDHDSESSFEEHDDEDDDVDFR